MTRFIICKVCRRLVRCTPQESHYLTLCKECYIKSKTPQIPEGICILDDSDQE